MDAFTELSSRRRAKLVKRQKRYATPSPLLLPAPLYPSQVAEQAPEVRFASVPLRSPCPISPVQPKLATHALYAAITEATASEGPNFVSSETQKIVGLEASICIRHLMRAGL
jgi:hypothetical protein